MTRESTESLVTTKQGIKDTDAAIAVLKNEIRICPLCDRVMVGDDKL